MFANPEIIQDAQSHREKLARSPIRWIFLGLFFIGLAAFLAGTLGDTPQRAWQVYLVNLVFFLGVAQGMVVFAAALQLTSARWGRPIKRLAENGAVFLPVGAVLLAVLYLGREQIFPWIAHPVPEKQAWLNVPFFFVRDLVMVAILAGLSLAFLRTSVRADEARLSASGPDSKKPNSIAQKLSVWGTLLAVLYAIFFSLLGFDLIMSLDPHWYSTLFGAYFFITSFFAALAAVVVIVSLVHKIGPLSQYIRGSQFHDLGKLLFGFAIVSGDFFYSQFLVIWYGNIPEETRYVILRLREMPWKPLSYAVLFVAFVIPFVVLLSRKLKQKPGWMLALGGLVLAGVWLEKFLLVVPSIWPQGSLPLGPMEMLISLGFLGLFGAVYLWNLARVPILPVGDPLFHEYLEHVNEGSH